MTQRTLIWSMNPVPVLATGSVIGLRYGMGILATTFFFIFFFVVWGTRGGIVRLLSEPLGNVRCHEAKEPAPEAE